MPQRHNNYNDGIYQGNVLNLIDTCEQTIKEHMYTRVAPLDITAFVPAPAQGMMGIQCNDNRRLTSVLKRLHCDQDGMAVAAERTLLNRLDGGCQLPFGVNVSSDGDAWRLEAFLAASPEDPAPLRLSLTGDSPEDVTEQAWTRIQEHRSAGR